MVRKVAYKDFDATIAQGDWIVDFYTDHCGPCKMLEAVLEPILFALGRFQKYPRPMSAVERIPQVPAPTPHKILGPGIDGRGIPRGPRGTRMGTGIS